MEINKTISLKAKLTRLRNEKIKISKELKDKLTYLRRKKLKITTELIELEETCEHNFIWGYTLEPVIFCEICNRDATEIFPNMSYKHIEKLVNNE